MTPNREHLVDLLLDQLSPAEENQVRTALQHDPRLLKEYQADQEALVALLEDMDVGEVTVPEGAESRLLSRVRAQSGGPAPQPPALPLPPTTGERAMPLLALLSLVAALGLALVLRPPDDLLRRYQAAPGAVARQVGVTGQGNVQLVRLASGQVFVRMPRAAPGDRTYQLWALRGQTPVSLGVFTQDYLSPALSPATTLAVTVEPAGGSPQPTSKPLFAEGS